MKKLFVIGLAAFTLTACQTPSQNIVVENSSNVNIVANNTAANPYGGGYYTAPAPAPVVYAAPQQQCIWTRTANPYYQSRVCY